MLKRREINGDVYDRREILKKLGARWDSRARVWYLPAYENANVVERLKELGFTVSMQEGDQQQSSKDSMTNIVDLKPGHVIIRGIITLFNIMFSYKACPVCLKKKIRILSACSTCGSDSIPVDRLVLMVTLDDGTGAIKVRIAGRASESFLDLTHEQALGIIQQPQEGLDSLLLENRLLTVLGREIIISGYVYISKFSNLLEMSARDFKIIKVMK
ncbi:MAG: DUF5710 domain-containing protein [Candidatus Hodarchaeales archaeon]|jgi:hypothetical protein